MKLKFLAASAILLTISIAATVFAGSFLEKKNRAGLQVITPDVTSSVFLNGQYLDKTPLVEKTLKPGVYTVRIEPDDATLVSYDTTITLRAGVLSVITWKSAEKQESSGGVLIEMEPIPSTKESEVSIISIPDNAIISLDAGEKQFAPVKIPNVSAGPHEFEATLPSYETQRHTIDVVPGYRMLLTVKLAKLANTDTEEKTQPSVATQPAELQSQVSATTSAVATASARFRTATSSASTAKQVKILSTNFFQNGKEVLRVRNNPGSLGAEVGFVEVGKVYPYLESTASGWVKLLFESTEGWVSGDYTDVVQ